MAKSPREADAAPRLPQNPANRQQPRRTFCKWKSLRSGSSTDGSFCLYFPRQVAELAHRFWNERGAHAWAPREDWFPPSSCCAAMPEKLLPRQGILEAIIILPAERVLR